MAADADRLKQVLWNLLSNAIKFTPSGGCVAVRVDATPDDVLLTVRDSGIGFETEVATHLFERFRQGDSSSTREHGGLGLGLGIVRHVVELHGGIVSAASGGENAGSTFAVRLPLRPLTAPAAEPPHDLPTAAPTLRGVSVPPAGLAFVGPLGGRADGPGTTICSSIGLGSAEPSGA